jgi:hypothetical protein
MKEKKVKLKYEIFAKLSKVELRVIAKKGS